LLKYVMVGVGGFIGAIARFWVASFVGARMGIRFPYGTFIINISGSFLIGFILTLLTAKAHLSPNWRYLIPVGFIGAYTTFSTFEFETLRSIQDGQFVIASLNVVLSVVLGFMAVWAGAVAGRAIP
jgi:CrcB protein